jgi:hypothetical protein
MDGRAAILEPSRTTPVLGEYEVVVLGGGPAGIAAAAAAARTGRSTLLVERYGFLGGAGTAAGLSTFCGLHANVHGEHTQVIHGLVDELLERLQRMGGLNAPHLSLGGKVQAQAYDISAYKIAADDLLVSSGVKILFHAAAVGMVKRGDREIDALLVESKSGRAAIRGRMFIECSGDGDLAAWAGAPFELGDGAGNMLYPSTMFRINGVDPIKAGRAWEDIPRLMEEAERRDGRNPPESPADAGHRDAGMAPAGGGLRPLRGDGRQRRGPLGPDHPLRQPERPQHSGLRHGRGHVGAGRHAPALRGVPGRDGVWGRPELRRGD